MHLQEFDYSLPSELIAQYPLGERSASRLLHLDARSGCLSDCLFTDLRKFLRPGDVLVFNDTRVIKARLVGAKETGGRCEVLVERILGKREVLAQISASHPPQSGSFLRLECGIRAEVIARHSEFYELRFEEDARTALDRSGRIALPPYIDRPADPADEARYQTVYAREAGAVAAPTAGLHFNEAIMNGLAAAGISFAFVTLHVGAGTFQPVRAEELSEHRMHTERYCVPEATVAAIEAARSNNGRVVAVGTTTLRALEAAAQNDRPEAGDGETALFITPGYRFQRVDLLLTNFHLPKSTLLILVSAFGGIENIHRAYRHAIAERYRFLSYGDAMLIERASAI